MKKVLILGNMNDRDAFLEATIKVAQNGDAPINPVLVRDALPGAVNNSDFILIMYDLARIADTVMLLPGWDKDLVSRLAKNSADTWEKKNYNMEARYDV